MKTVDGMWVPESSGVIKLHSAQDMIELVEEVGFIPYFKGRAENWSVEELCDPTAWWNEADPESDPWEWRRVASRNENIAYGKFFENRAGFISKKWFPYFASYRRDGYDFDSAWDDEIPTRREKLIIDAIGEKEMYSCDLKRAAGFGKGGEKGFDGAVLKLQMSSYLLIADFRRKVSKKGDEYGWHHTVLSTPEAKWGEHIRSQYLLGTDKCFDALLEQAKQLAPDTGTDELIAMLEIKR